MITITVIVYSQAMTAAPQRSSNVGEFTVDELAREVGTMTTTVRMYQAKRLLAPPSKRGRVAVYDRSHVDRLRLIADLQQRGHSLAGIADLLESHDRGAPMSELLGLRSWSEPEPLRLPVAELFQRLGGDQINPELIARAMAAGLVRLEGSDAIMSDRRFLEIGEALMKLGVHPATVLDEWNVLATAMGTVADRFVDLFESQLLPTLEGTPLPEVAAVLDRLAELARDVTITALDTALRVRAEHYLPR
jgi:DNA-binding transcriptional MerR regulator